MFSPLSTNQNTGSYDPAVQFGNMDIKSNEYEGFGDELIVDSALQEELVIRQKWSSYRVLEGGESEESAPGIGEYRDVLDNEPHTIVLKRPDGRLEPSESYVGRDARGQARSLQLFPGAAIVDEDAFADWMRISAACPFAANLFDAFLDNGSLCLVYELDGSAVSMASALRTSAIDGGFIASSKAAEEALMEQWLAQLLWTIRLVHQEQQWFIGAQLLGNPQNILLSSQNHRLRIHGLGAVQLLALARSPLEYTTSEIRAQQLQDLKALSDLLKNFLSGPRRWLVRSPLFAPILAFLDQRLALSVTPVTDLLLLPASQNLLQKLFLASFRYLFFPFNYVSSYPFRRQDFLEHQMMLQIQSERVLGLLTRLIYVTERFKYYTVKNASLTVY